MSQRWLLFVLISLAASWASSVNPAAAQSSDQANADAFGRLLQRAIEIFEVQRWTPDPGRTLPSSHYLKHPPQYVPPSEPFPLPRELKALEGKEAPVCKADFSKRLEEARHLMKQNRLEEAVVELRRLREIDPEDVRVLAALHLVTHHLAVKEYERTEAAKLRKQREIDPENPLPFPSMKILENTARTQPVELDTATNARAIERRLRQPISLNMKNLPLQQAIKDIAAASGVPIVLDVRALEDERVNLDAAVSLQVDDIDMKTALNLLLDPLRLGYGIENNALKITTDSAQRGPLVRVTYPIRDLLGDMKPGTAPEEDLMKLIVHTVAKDSWEPNGGRATIQYFPLGKALVIFQYRDAHEEIAHLLAAVRSLNEVTVASQVVFVTTTPATGERLAKAMTRHGKPGAPYVAVNDACVRDLLELAQSDRASVLNQAPKLTHFNGQNIPLQVTTKQAAVTELRSPALVQTAGAKNDKAIVLAHEEKPISGYHCDVQPVVTPDRKSVRLTLRLEHFAKDDRTATEHIVRATKMFTVPDGQTLIWNLGATANGQHLFLLVTPRIQVREAEERIFQGEIEPIPGR